MQFQHNNLQSDTHMHIRTKRFLLKPGINENQECFDKYVKTLLILFIGTLGFICITAVLFWLLVCKQISSLKTRLSQIKPISIP
jgi:hypothetical protein